MIVLALLVVWLVVAVAQRGGIDRMPHGGTMPREAEPTATMPPSPASGSGARHAGRNGPQEPSSSDAPK